MPNVSLTGPLEEYIDLQIKSGRFANPSEAMRAGVYSLMKSDAEYQRFLELRAEFADAGAQADRGEYEPFDMKEFEPRLITGFQEE